MYPGYVKTNISKNSLLGSGEKFGKTDSNIRDGMTVDFCCTEILKALYLRRYEYIIGNVGLKLLPILGLFDWVC